MAVREIQTIEIVPGDIVTFMGRSHRIESTSERNGFDMPIARAADGWGITMCTGSMVEVDR